MWSPSVWPFQRATLARPWAMSSISMSSGEGSRRSRRRPDSIRCQARGGGTLRPRGCRVFATEAFSALARSLTHRLTKINVRARVSAAGLGVGRMSMDWARIMAPLSGGEGDRHVVAWAAALAEPFGAELACVHAPPDVADLIPWMGDGFMGGVQASAVDSIRQAAAEGAKAAKALVDACPYARKSFRTLASPVWAA